MVQEAVMKEDYLSYIFIKKGTFVENHFLNQYEEDGYCRIEIEQFSNHMRSLVNQSKQLYGVRINHVPGFIKKLGKTLKTLVVARDQNQDDCMTDYIESLIKGEKHDFDIFYRKVRKN